MILGSSNFGEKILKYFESVQTSFYDSLTCHLLKNAYHI